MNGELARIREVGKGKRYLLSELEDPGRTRDARGGELGLVAKKRRLGKGALRDRKAADGKPERAQVWAGEYGAYRACRESGRVEVGYAESKLALLRGVSRRAREQRADRERAQPGT